MIEFNEFGLYLLKIKNKMVFGFTGPQPTERDFCQFIKLSHFGSAINDIYINILVAICECRAKGVSSLNDIIFALGPIIININGVKLNSNEMFIHGSSNKNPSNVINTHVINIDINQSNKNKFIYEGEEIECVLQADFNKLVDTIMSKLKTNKRK